jgi:peptidoglycan/LPS O-acetylase OafA/YrhL
VIASLDMSPFLSVGLGAGMVASCVWYWHQLGSLDVRPSTRGLRRSSLVFSVLAVVALVRAASFIDYEAQPALYIQAWLGSVALVFLVVVFVAFDVFNSFRIQRRELENESIENASKLSSQLKDVIKLSGREKGGNDEQ